MTDEEKVNAGIEKLKHPDTAKEFIKKLNFLTVSLGDKEIKIDSMNEAQIMQFANKTVCFSLAVMKALVES